MRDGFEVILHFTPGIDNAVLRLTASEARYAEQVVSGQSWTVYFKGAPVFGCPTESAAHRMCKELGRGYTCSRDRPYAGSGELPG